MAFLLTQCNGKDEFLRKHASGELNWPLLVHARVSRRTRAGGADRGASQLAAASQNQPQYVNHMLEAAEAVTWARESAPNQCYQDVRAILNNCPPHDEGIAFAYLADIRPDPH